MQRVTRAVTSAVEDTWRAVTAHADVPRADVPSADATSADAALANAPVGRRRALAAALATALPAAVVGLSRTVPVLAPAVQRGLPSSLLLADKGKDGRL
jgi:hypothetical protein